MKKAVTLILAAALMLSAFAGCAAGTENTVLPSSEETAEPVDQAEVTEAPPEETADTPEQEIPIIYPIAEGDVSFDIFITSTPFVNAMDDYASFAAAEEATGVHVNWREVSFLAAAEQTAMMLASQDYPDMFVSANNGAISNNMTVNEALDQNVVYDIGPYLAENAPDYYQRISDDDLLAQCMLGEDSAVFVYMLYSDFSSIRGDMIRKDWLDALGLDIPKTYDELTNVLEAFHSNYNTDSTYLFPGDGCQYYSLVAGYGVPYYMTGTSGAGSFYQIDGEVNNTLVSEGYHEYIEMIADWYAKDLISQDFITINSSFMDPTRKAKILTGETGVFYVSCNAMGSYAEESGVEGFELAPLQNITKTGTETVHFVEDYTPVGQNSICLMTGMDEDLVPTALQWINYWYTDEGSLLFTYGIEHEAWEYGDDGLPYFTELITSADTPNTEMLKYSLSSGWVGYAPRRISTYWYSDLQKAAAETWASNADSAYMIIKTEIRAEDARDYSEKMASIATYADEMILKFITGSESLSNWDSFVDTLYDLGMYDCIGYEQSAYNDKYGV